MSRPIRNAADLDQAAAAGQATLYPAATEDPRRLGQLRRRRGRPGGRGGGPPRRRGTRAGRRRLPDGLHRLLRARAAAGSRAPQRAAGELRQHDPREDPRSCSRPTPKRRPQAGAGPWAASHSEEHGLDRRSRTTYPPCPTAAPATCPSGRSLDFYRRQKKVILRNCGSIDPDVAWTRRSPAAPIAAPLRALTQMTPDAVIDEMIQSGLRGRGGAAFPTGQKWRLARQAAADVKYVVCNADEGEPGAYMDRTVLEGDPHAVLEGMLIGSYAIGASEGFIYVRSEYPLAIEILEHAIDEAEKRGLLGDEHFRQRLVVPRHGPPRGRGLHLRRGDRPDRIARRPLRRAAHPPAVSGHRGPVGQAHRGQQREDLGQRRRRSSRGAPPGTPRWAPSARRARRSSRWKGPSRTPGWSKSPSASRSASWSTRSAAGCVGDRPLKALQAGGASRGCIPPSMLDLAIDTEDRAGRDDHDRHRRDHRAGRHAPAWSTWPGSSSASSWKSRAASAFPAARAPSRCTAS